VRELHTAKAYIKSAQEYLEKFRVQDLDEEDLPTLLGYVKSYMQTAMNYVNQAQAVGARVYWIMDIQGDLHVFGTPDEAHRYLGALAFQNGNNVEDFCDDRTNVKWGNMAISFVSDDGDNE
jgi:hypothetical protein